MTQELLLSINEKYKAKWRAAKTNSTHDLAVYKCLNNKLKISIHEAKLHYLRSLVKQSKCNPSQLWRSVNDIIGRSTSYDSGITSNISVDALNFFAMLQFLLPTKLLITLRLHLHPILIHSSLHLFLFILSSICFSILMFGNPQALMAFPHVFFEKLQVRFQCFLMFWIYSKLWMLVKWYVLPFWSIWFIGSRHTYYWNG